jgi:ABC-type glutathione transport system ATPase component
MSTLVDIRDLVIRFPATDGDAGGEGTAIEVPHLQIRDREIVALVGESGSGKTTTLLAMVGLVSESAQVSGDVVTCGVRITGASARQLRQVRGSKAALVFQSPQSAFTPTMRLGDFASAAMRLHGHARATIPSTLNNALDAVSLDPAIASRYPHQVSGGQAQRFAIALALSLGADLLLADEPTSALDVTVQAEIVTLFKRLRDERGLTIVVVSHDLALVSGLADRLLVMKDGQVVEQGPTSTVIGSPESDYTRDLIAAVPSIRSGEES